VRSLYGCQLTIMSPIRHRTTSPYEQTEDTVNRPCPPDAGSRSNSACACRTRCQVLTSGGCNAGSEDIILDALLVMAGVAELALAEDALTALMVESADGSAGRPVPITLPCSPNTSRALPSCPHSTSTTGSPRSSSSPELMMATACDAARPGPVGTGCDIRTAVHCTRPAVLLVKITTTHSVGSTGV